MLLAFLELAHENAAIEYRHESLIYTMNQGRTKTKLSPPTPPRFLRLKR